MKITRYTKGIIYLMAGVFFSCSAFASSVALTSYEDLSPGDSYFAITGTDPVNLPMLTNKFVLIDGVEFHLRDEFIKNASVVYVDVNKLKKDYDGKIERQIDNAYALGAFINFDAFEDKELISIREEYLQNKYGTRYGSQRFVTVFNREVVNQQYEDKPFYELAALNARNAGCSGYPEAVSIFFQFMSFVPVVGTAFALGDTIGNAVDSMAKCPDSIKKEMAGSKTSFLISKALTNQLAENVKVFFDLANEKNLPASQRNPSVRVETLYPTAAVIGADGLAVGFPGIGVLAKHASVVFELNKIDYVYHQKKYKRKPKEQEVARQRIMTRLHALSSLFYNITEYHHDAIKGSGLGPNQYGVWTVDKTRLGDKPPCTWIDHPPPRHGGYWLCPPAPTVDYSIYEVLIGGKIYGDSREYKRTQKMAALAAGWAFRRGKVLELAAIEDDVIRVVAKIGSFQKFLRHIGPVKANNLLPKLDKMNEVRIFSGNFNGTEKSLPVGNYKRGSFGLSNNTMSSLQVPYGLEVTVYDGDRFKGASIRYNASSVLAPELNNKVSSISIYKTNTLYKHLVSYNNPYQCMAYTKAGGFFLYTCRPYADQLWHQDKAGRIRNLATGECITTENKSLKMRHCKAQNKHQTWYSIYNGAFRAKVSNLCIDGYKDVLLNTCHSGSDQKWHHKSYRLGFIP